MNKTAIEWCDFTANPIRYRDDAGKSVWACLKASEGCQHCYAEALAHRYQGRDFTAKAMEGVTPYVDERELKAMLSPTKLLAGSRVFVGDMTDMFGPWVPFELMDRVFAVFALRPDVVFQVLTKRPERLREYLTRESVARRIFWQALELTLSALVRDPDSNVGDQLVVERGQGIPWPLPNVWLGVSAENQHWADVRTPELLATPAAVRFVSAEPLLGPVDFTRLQPKWMPREKHPYDPIMRLDALQGLITGMDEYLERDELGRHRKLDWIIFGGESGPRARPCDVGWIRSIVAQCQAAGTKVFVKQLGARPQLDRHWRLDGDPDTVMVRQRIELRDRKGGDPGEWPEDLRVREWPLSTEAKR